MTVTMCGTERSIEYWDGWPAMSAGLRHSKNALGIIFPDVIQCEEFNGAYLTPDVGESFDSYRQRFRRLATGDSKMAMRAMAFWDAVLFRGFEIGAEIHRGEDGLFSVTTAVKAYRCVTAVTYAGDYCHSGDKFIASMTDKLADLRVNQRHETHRRVMQV